MPSSAIHAMQAAIRAAIDPALIPDLAFHSMFGGMAAYAHGRTFALLSSVGLALKLPPDVQAELLAEAEARPLQFEEGGVVFKQYVLVPDVWIAEPARLELWVAQSVAYVMTLPVKGRKGG
jgi:TfoX/Sxy family transcriptional regulator of competence genes